MKGPKILIEIPPNVNHKIMVFQALMEDLKQPIPTKRGIITRMLETMEPWLDEKIEIANEAVQAVGKV